jgi:hypothetical protein
MFAGFVFMPAIRLPLMLAPIMLMPFMPPPAAVVVISARWPASGDHAKDTECRYYRSDRTHNHLLTLICYPLAASSFKARIAAGPRQLHAFSRLNNDRPFRHAVRSIPTQTAILAPRIIDLNKHRPSHMAISGRLTRNSYRARAFIHRINWRISANFSGLDKSGRI